MKNKMQTTIEAESTDAAEDAIKTSNFHNPIPSEDNLLEMPPAKAVLTNFPPGCPVLFSDTSGDSLLVLRGTITSVFIDLTPEKSSRDYFYKVSFDQQNNSAIAGETQLQWAPSCPVSTKPQDTSGGEWMNAIIVGSYQEGVCARTQYSVQAQRALLHGVNQEHLRYRTSSDVAPDPGNESVSQPAVKKTGAQFAPIVFESPTSTVDPPPAPAAISHSDSLQQVSDVSSQVTSTLKRSSLSERPNTEARDETTKKQKDEDEEEKQRVGRRSSVPGCGIKRRKPAPCIPPQPNDDDMSISEGEEETSKRARIEESPLESSTIHDTTNAELRDNNEGIPEAQNNEPVLREAFGKAIPPSKLPQDLPTGASSNRAVDGEEKETEAIFNIPDNVFRSNHIKEFFRGHMHRLMRETGCLLRLKSRDGRHGEELYVEVRGSKRAVDSGLCVLEESLLRQLPPFEKGRALYYMALLNSHRYTAERGGYKIVYQYHYHCKTKRSPMQCVVHKHLPNGSHDALGLALGKGGCRKKSLMKDYRCGIEVNSQSCLPHFLVYGNDEESVVRGAQEFQARLDEAINFDRRHSM